MIKVKEGDHYFELAHDYHSKKIKRQNYYGFLFDFMTFIGCYLDHSNLIKRKCIDFLIKNHIDSQRLEYFLQKLMMAQKIKENSFH